MSKPRKSLFNFSFIKKRQARNLLNECNKLHLGCGPIRLAGYINIDAIHTGSVDFCCNLNRLYDFFPPNSVAEIYICHALEHFPARFLPLYLKQFHYLLQPGGILRISVPDIEKILAAARLKKWGAYELDLLQGVIGGGQDLKYNYHKTFFWPAYLAKKLQDARFSDIEEYPLRPHFTGQDIQDASNGAGFEPFGIGLSLNMMARK